MRTTALKELTRKLPALANQCKDGTNTFSHDWEHFLPWECWAEFNAENLYGMFRHVLEAEWQAPANLACALLEEDKSFAAEDMLEHQVLSRVVIPVVNAALQHACRLQGVGYTLFITRHGGSTFAGSRFRPDWVLCSTAHITDHGYYVPRMAGDTKESVKFHSARVTLHGPDSDSAYPVRQAVSYAVDAGARYAFIITDAELVVLRVTSMHTGSGIAATRPRRPAQPVQFGHASHPSTGTAISQISDRLMATSITDSAASYQPAPATDVPFVEYQIVPWANHDSSGRGLTVGLALFYLALMSGLGTSNLQFQYPTLDSCWPAVSGRFYHNSTGLASKTPMAGLEHPDPSADRAARWVSVPGLDGTPMDCITFESAVMQDVVQQNGVYHRQYMYQWSEAVEWGEDGEPTHHEEREMAVILNADILVYDQARNQVGYFIGLRWEEGFPAPSAKRSRAPSASGGDSSKHGGKPKRHGESSKRSKR